MKLNPGSVDLFQAAVRGGGSRWRVQEFNSDLLDVQMVLYH